MKPDLETMTPDSPSSSDNGPGRQGKAGRPLDLDEIDLARDAEEQRATRLTRLKRIFTPATKRDAQNYRRLFQYVKPHLWKVIIAMLFAAAAGSLVIWQLQLLEDGVQAIKPDAQLKESATGAAGEQNLNLSATEQQQRSDELGKVALLFVAVVAGGALLKFFQTILMSAVTRKIIRKVRDDCFEHLVQLPLKFHHSTHSGKITARLTKDINKLSDLLVSLSIQFTRELFVFIGALGFALWKTTWAAAFAVAFVLIAIVPIRIIADRIRSQNREEEAGQADVFAVLSEALAGQKIIKAFTGEKHELKKFKRVTKGVYRRQIGIQRLRATTEPVIDVVGGIGMAGAIWILGNWVIQGSLQLSVLVVVILALQRMTASVRKLGKMNNDFAKGITGAERICALLDVEPEVRDHSGAVPLDAFRSELRFENLTFSYLPGDTVLKNIDLTVNKGDTVAIVGPSGAGKTSLIDMVPRFYDPDSGRITLDGRSLADYTLDSLRAKIGIVSQDTMLFRDTIRENIAYGLKNVGNEAVIAAAKAAHAHDFIMEKEGGYDSEMGERGLRLSGGERQRIAIARAILKDPPILILDEATSALDAESEAKVQDALNFLMQGRTTLVIAHRLSTIARADKIIVLERGSIAECGSHEELLAKGGRYATAYKLQKQALDRGDSESSLDEFFDGEGA